MIKIRVTSLGTKTVGGRKTVDRNVRAVKLV